MEIEGIPTIFKGRDGTGEVIKGIEREYVSAPALSSFPLFDLNKTYTEGTSYDTSETAEFIISRGGWYLTRNLEYKGMKIFILIYNRIGETESYDWALKNITTGITLDSGTNNLPNKDVFNKIYLFGKEYIREGDEIKFEITDGILGTNTGELSNGAIRFKLDIITDETGFREFIE